MVSVSDVSCVAVVCHDDVNRNAGFDGDWIDLLAEDSVEALGKVCDSSRKRVLVDDCMFESDRETVMSVSGSLAGTGREQAVVCPRFGNGIQLFAAARSPGAIHDTGGR